MRTTISHALDILEDGEHEITDATAGELLRVFRRVQTDYLEIIENALSLLVQNEDDECTRYLREERTKLEPVKDRIAALISGDDRWPQDFQRLAIEYLFTRARLVDEIRMFPNIALELLERMTLDQTLSETVAYLENAMTGKQDLYTKLVNTGNEFTSNT